ncbi:MAG: SUMF1/EgtB/PvdO family nonheme iron enzyme [Chlorobiaceae bacterium]|nr:SUMF1/EgtB/PvdO family nonheme iron enzyme [Chlorobiaceae bacterium]
MKGLARDKEVENRAEEVDFTLSALLSVSFRKALEKAGAAVNRNVFINPYEFDAQYIRIPGGRYIYSQTEKEVSIPGLWFAKYPVTNRQYRSFVDFLAGKSSEAVNRLSQKAYTEALHELARSGDKAIIGFDAFLKDEQDLAERFRSGLDDDRKFNKDEQPVVGMSWFGARAYCLWLSMLAGEEFRLPTEKEWEWAGGGRREEPREVLKAKAYPWGDKPEPTPNHANYNSNEGATTPVGRYPDGATPEGVYDMAGNVWEWMENWYDERSEYKALRGGSWDDAPEYLRCSARVVNVPDGRNNGVGFRVVRPSPKLDI